MISRTLGMPNEVGDRWDAMFGGSYSCSDYLESYLLPAQPAPLLLVLDEVNTILSYPETATDFFGMLRAWYEQGRHQGYSNFWERLRLVIVHSTEVYLPLNVHQSPFNVGLLLELPPLSLEQVQELAVRYRQQPIDAYGQQLMDLVGGHPYLTQLAMFDLSQRSHDLAHLVETAIAPDSIFSSHLRQQFGLLAQDLDLLTGMRRVIQSKQGIVLHPTQAFKLQGLG
jgi:hypothetical protein